MPLVTCLLLALEVNTVISSIIRSVKSVIASCTSSHLNSQCSPHLANKKKCETERLSYIITYHIYIPTSNIVHFIWIFSPSLIFSLEQKNQKFEKRKEKKMEICYRHMFCATLLLFLASFTIIFMVLPLQFVRITDSESSHSVSLHHLRRKVSGDNHHLLAVEHAGHSNSTVTVISLLSLSMLCFTRSRFYVIPHKKAISIIDRLVLVLIQFVREYYILWSYRWNVEEMILIN